MLKVCLGRIIYFSTVLAIFLHPSALKIFRGKKVGKTSLWGKLIDGITYLGSWLRIFIATCLVVFSLCVVLGRYFKWPWLFKINMEIQRVCCFFGFIKSLDETHHEGPSLEVGGRIPRPPINPGQIQKVLDENAHLIQTIQDYQNKGKGQECMQYQQALHRNLVYLASVADGNQSQNIQQMLPPPGQEAAMQGQQQAMAQSNPQRTQYPPSTHHSQGYPSQSLSSYGDGRPTQPGQYGVPYSGYPPQPGQTQQPQQQQPQQQTQQIPSLNHPQQQIRPPPPQMSGGPQGPTSGGYPPQPVSQQQQQQQQQQPPQQGGPQQPPPPSQSHSGYYGHGGHPNYPQYPSQQSPYAQQQQQQQPGQQQQPTGYPASQYPPQSYPGNPNAPGGPSAYPGQTQPQPGQQQQQQPGTYGGYGSSAANPYPPTANSTTSVGTSSAPVSAGPTSYGAGYVHPQYGQGYPPNPQGYPPNPAANPYGQPAQQGQYPPYQQYQVRGYPPQGYPPYYSRPAGPPGPSQS